MMLWVAAAWAGGVADVSVLAGVRGNAESTLEQPEAATLDTLEPSATAAVLADGRWRWKSGLWVSGAGEAWTYAPEPDATLLRAVPAVGVALPLGEHAHLDLAARYSLEAVPLRAGRTNGRAEATGAVGLDLGAHRLALVGAGVSRDWFDRSAWSFRTAEAGLSWEWQPSAWRLGARATGQLNSGATVNADGGLDPATGQQLRLGASGGWTGRHWDIGLDYRMYLADEGQVEDAARPQFTPIGDYDDDADALSAGGFSQHRIGLTATGQFGPAWTLDLDVLARVRVNEPGQATTVFSRTFHAGLDVGRVISGPWSVHAVGAFTTLDLATGGTSYDPSGWLLLRWSPPAK